MSVKRAFFSVFQKIMVVCCAIFFGFANAFSANLPSGYTELEYIESTGTQWIDTGYIPSITDTLTTVIKSPSTLPTSGVYYLYGTRDAYLVNGFVIQLYKNFYLQYGEKDTGNLGALVADTDYTIVQKGPTYSVNGDSVTVSNASTPVLTRPLYLFTANNGGEVHASKSSFRLYSFTAKSSDSSYKTNLIPAKNSSGVVGMYDTVNNRFYTNQGTGEFTAGPVVGIRIATTAYNTAQFNPVVTDLNSTIATIRDIVTKTINQTAAIASLQADKQTRPEDACPAGKKCLLVETEENGVIVPHWFPIIEDVD